MSDTPLFEIVYRPGEDLGLEWGARLKDGQSTLFGNTPQEALNRLLAYHLVDKEAKRNQK